MTNNLVLYHENCSDGIFAAHAAYRYFGDNAEYFPVQYGDPPPYEHCTKNTQVYILDFCYPEAVYDTWVNEVGHITVLDHHIGAVEIMQSIDKHPAITAYYDNERSGALLAWDYFFPDTPRPPLYTYVDSYDRGEWELFGTEAIEEVIQLEERTLTWATKLLKKDVQELADTGAILLKKADRQVEELSLSAIHYSFKNIPLMGVNAPRYLRNALGHMLAKHSASGCAFTWQREGIDSVRYSVRSVVPENPINGLSITALELAKYFGGGNHEHAAGFVSSKYPEELFR